MEVDPLEISRIAIINQNAFFSFQGDPLLGRRGFMPVVVRKLIFLQLALWIYYVVLQHIHNATAHNFKFLKSPHLKHILLIQPQSSTLRILVVFNHVGISRSALVPHRASGLNFQALKALHVGIISRELESSPTPMDWISTSSACWVVRTKQGLIRSICKTTSQFRTTFKKTFISGVDR